MNELQKSIIIGTILGDSYVHFSKAGTTSLSIKQADQYREYVFWLCENLKFMFSSKPKQRPDNRQWYARSSYSKELNELHTLFYKNGIKIVPKRIDQLLISPISLAVWFMDDGTLDYRKKDHCAFHLCTNCFTKKDVERLTKMLKSNFGIVASVHYTLCRGIRHARIYIGAQGRDRFIELVTPYVLDCFKYKLPQYRTPQRLDSIRNQIVGGEANIKFADGLL